MRHIIGLSISKSHPLLKPSLASRLWDASTGLVRFIFRTLNELLKPPWDAHEVSHQLYAIGWRSVPLILVSGVVVGVAMTKLVWTSLVNLGGAGSRGPSLPILRFFCSTIRGAASIPPRALSFGNCWLA
jgi:hypothetical protein